MVQFNEHTKALNDFDDKLNELERAARQTEEERREYINRHGLNKPVKDSGYTKG